MLQPKDKIDYPVYFYEHQLKKALTLDEVANITIKDKKDCWFDSDNSRTIS
jgi:hypothetical protein